MDCVKEFLLLLEAEKLKAAADSESLSNDFRSDEANISKIHANIYSIIISVTNAALSNCSNNPAEFIRNKIMSFTSIWEESLLEAERHSDYSKVAIECEKLKVLKDISRKLASVSEGVL